MTPDLPQVESYIVQMANDFRASEQRAALRRDPRLDAIAKSYARYLARTGKFSHTADGRKPAERAQRGGYAFCQVAENLALNRDSRGFKSRQLASLAMTGWKNSPGHRRNLLRRYVTEIGVGVAKAPETRTYISVQLFGRPDALKMTFKVRNTSGARVTYRYGSDEHRIDPRVEATHTVCQPGRVEFLFSGNSGQRQPLGEAFPVSNADMFLIRRGQSGRVVVNQRAGVN
ncbi:MAG: CAP domain-containing protein [Pseudomonadota bacterium]